MPTSDRRDWWERVGLPRAGARRDWLRLPRGYALASVARVDPLPVSRAEETHSFGANSGIEQVSRRCA